MKTTIRDNYKIIEKDKYVFIQLNNRARSICIIDIDDVFILDTFSSINIHRNRVCVARFVETEFSSLPENLAIHRLIMRNTKQNSRGSQLAIDHINRDFLDNRKENLRFCNYSENSANKKPRSSTGYRGVVKHKRKLKKPYVAYAQIKIDGKYRNKNIGYFDCPKEAAIEVDKYQWEKYGEFAFLNFPENYKANNGQAIERPKFEK